MGERRGEVGDWMVEHVAQSQMGEKRRERIHRMGKIVTKSETGECLR